ncbi:MULTISPECIES: DUF2190 family protein [unclassified Haematobacter]|uniref:DUF2190 family protein n=1 Tax=unclassified Haematobacter TaxID=2640585 RepID=UPI0025BA8E0D|nr:MULTISPECIES: DUF2190 family protein [unclassified Haematobacter]
MKNFVAPGYTVPLIATAAIKSGDGILSGALFGVAHGDAAVGEKAELATTGVFDLPKTAGQAWTQHAKVYWNNTAKACTTTASGNTLIGVAYDAATAGLTTGRVRLNGAVA